MSLYVTYPTDQSNTVRHSGYENGMLDNGVDHQRVAYLCCFWSRRLLNNFSLDIFCVYSVTTITAFQNSPPKNDSL